MLNTIRGINESKDLTKHISFEVKYEFDGRKYNSNQKWNNDKYEYKKHNICEKDYIWNLATCCCKNGKYLANVIDDSVIKFDEIIEPYNQETKRFPTNFNEESSL